MNSDSCYWTFGQKRIDSGHNKPLKWKKQTKSNKLLLIQIKKILVHTFVWNSEKYIPKLCNPADINIDQAKVICSATSLVKQKEPQILIQTVLKNWLYLNWE